MTPTPHTSTNPSTSLDAEADAHPSETQPGRVERHRAPRTADVGAPDLSWLADLPGRCPKCLMHIEAQGHAAEVNGRVTGCTPSGPLGLFLARRDRDRGMQQTVDAHPDDAARVDRVLAQFIATGRPFTANDTRPHLVGVKGSVVGSRWGAASRAGRIKRTGQRVPSTDPGTHAHLIDTWVAA